MVYMTHAAGRLDRRPADRPAPRGALRRHPDRLRPLQHGVPVARHLLSRPVPDRHRHRAAQGQRQRHRRTALCDRGTARRDAGFSIFYMGINLGAFIAPLICGYLGQRVNWHVGFAAAGVGMVIGVIQYILGGKYLGDAGVRPARRRLAGSGCRRAPPGASSGGCSSLAAARDRRRRRIHRAPADHGHADRRRRPATCC